MAAKAQQLCSRGTRLPQQRRRAARAEQQQAADAGGAAAGAAAAAGAWPAASVCMRRMVVVVGQQRYAGMLWLRTDGHSHNWLTINASSASKNDVFCWSVLCG